MEMLNLRAVLRVVQTTADCVIELLALAIVEVRRSSAIVKISVMRTCDIRVAVGHSTRPAPPTRRCSAPVVQISGTWLSIIWKKLQELCYPLVYRRVLLIGGFHSHGAYKTDLDFSDSSDIS